MYCIDHGVYIYHTKLLPPPIPLITPQITSKGNRDDHSGVFQVRCHPSSPLKGEKKNRWLGTWMFWLEVRINGFSKWVISPILINGVFVGVITNG